MSAFGTADFPSSSLVLSHATQKLPGSENETERCGRWYLSEDEIQKEKGKRATYSLSFRVLLTCPPITPLNKCQSLITISKVAETLKTIIMSVFPRGTWKITWTWRWQLTIYSAFIVGSRTKSPTGTNNQYTIVLCMHCDWSDATYLHNYHNP